MPAGYFRDEQSSKRAYIDGWFYPGDYGFVRDGELFVRGRTSEIINASGSKVIAGELEQLLLRLPGIEDAAIFVETDGEGVDRIVAAVVGPADTSSPTWLEHVSSYLGDAAPARYVRVAEVPRNENGKIMRDALPALVGG